MKKIIPALIALLALACSLTNSLRLAEPSATGTPHPTGTTAAQVCIVTATHLNFRNAPGMTAAVIAVLDYGEVVTIRPAPAEGNWIPVTARGRDGWIYQTYCNLKQ
ncbi:MAG: SH3 domain-containing protein [Anaerolineales bacterium]|nr:SH3 domain-containing protein [Anaerolineales bacterium]